MTPTQCAEAFIEKLKENYPGNGPSKALPEGRTTMASMTGRPAHEHSLNNSLRHGRQMLEDLAESMLEKYQELTAEEGSEDGHTLGKTAEHALKYGGATSTLETIATAIAAADHRDRDEPEETREERTRRMMRCRAIMLAAAHNAVEELRRTATNQLRQTGNLLAIGRREWEPEGPPKRTCAGTRAAIAISKAAEDTLREPADAILTASRRLERELSPETHDWREACPPEPA